MFVTARAALFGLLLAHACAASPPIQWGDAVCSLQTATATARAIQGSPDDLSEMMPAPGAAELSAKPRNGTQQRWRSGGACSETAEIHTFTVSVSQSSVTGGTRFTYTMTPTPAPKNAKGVSHIEFYFEDCTCEDPNEFSDLEMLDTKGSSVNIKEECGPSGQTTKRHLKFDNVPGKKGETYTVSYTVNHQNLETGAVPMKIKAGPTEYFGNDLCGPMCLPELPESVVTASPTETPTLSPTASPTTSSPTASPTGSPTTSSPTASPTGSPTTSSPTASPTGSPTTSSPTASPTATSPPTASPTGSLFHSPTSSPTSPPSYSPTVPPTSSPSYTPTLSPTSPPSYSPTSLPSYTPTSSPTGAPSDSPTPSPSVSPSSSPAAANCSTTAEIHMFAVSYSQQLVRGGTRFTYTLTPTPAPKNSAGISNIEFYFEDCTCESPDEFSDLEMLEYEDGSSAGSSISIKEECGSADRASEKTYLKFDDVGDKKGQTYTVSYTIDHQNLDIGAVPMKIKAGPKEYFGNDLCGPICLPELPGYVITASPTGSPTGFPTGSPTTSSPTGSPTASPTTSSPTGSPTASPTTSSPTASPTGSPTTSSPTASPTNSPTTSSPTASPTGSPTTSSPTASPTGSPTTSSPTPSPTGSPTTSSPTASPTGSPTTSSPTGSPTASPTTSSPTGSPTASPTTSSPTGSPTASPTTSSPTGSPTASPTTSSPTASPTGSPTTSSPTASPTQSPTRTRYNPNPYNPSPFVMPTASPTASPTTSSMPTVAPTSSHDLATSFGDPHVTNLKGERFDILQPNYHTFLLVPRGADEEHAQLRVVAKVDPLGPLCGGLLYVTGLKFSGSWLGEVGSLEFFTDVSAAMDAERAIRIKVGSSATLNMSQFKLAADPGVVKEAAALQPEEPQALNQHVDTFRVKLMLGPAIAKVRMVYQKEKIGFSNSLWLTTTGLKHAQHEVGGILGIDDHEAAATAPEKCRRGAKGTAAELMNSPAHHNIHAEATLEDVGYE